MLRTRRLIVVVASLSGMVAALVNCLADPREDEPVTVVSSCDRSQLSTDPTSPESTLLAYLQSADMLVQVTDSVAAQMRDACNAIGTDLGLATGGDVAAACRPVTARADEVSKNGGNPVPGFPHWVEMLYAPNCTPKPGALAECLSTCAGPCDVSKCDPAQQVGTCQGECTGQCVTRGDSVPCTGECTGTYAIGINPDGGAPQPSTCKGECTGVCTAPTWAGECAGACAGFFTGTCAGTCTGQCNGAPINVMDPPDAGPDDAGSDAGDGGGADAGPPPSGPPPLTPPPTNADGNCKGFCVGVCSKGANGFCANSPCLDFPPAGPPTPAAFTGGNCAQYDGLCVGQCVAAGGSGTTTTCTGQCTANKPQCDGTCVGGCNGTLANATCNGTPKCGQNAECQNACRARALLETTCEEPKSIEVYAISDPALEAALKAHAAQLGKASSQLPNLRDVLSSIRGRAYGDFVALGLRGDLVRACVAEGTEKVKSADAKITTMLAIDPSTRKTQ